MKLKYTKTTLSKLEQIFNARLNKLETKSTNRTDELEKLIDLISKCTYDLININGESGMSKTT